jgi:hypothetical protein
MTLAFSRLSRRIAGLGGFLWMPGSSVGEMDERRARRIPDIDYQFRPSRSTQLFSAESHWVDQERAWI